MGFKISVDPEKCIGCEACVSECDNFQMNVENKAIPVKANVEEIGCNKKAEEICPTQAIKIE